jgi:hypothetical protein
MANPDHVATVKQGAEAIRLWREQHPEERLSLYRADLHEIPLYEADLRKANLRKADLGEAHLNETDLRGTSLHEARLAGATMSNVRGAYRAHGLETTRLKPASGTGATDALYFETCVRPWWVRWLDWERLRVMGRLPLFGPSYFALILILILFYGLDFYSDCVKLVRAWAEQVVLQSDHPLHWLASLVLAHLRIPPIPPQSLCLFVSIIFLAAGSTLYIVFCPSRVKEFSREQWCYQLGRSLLHYWPFACQHCLVRPLCAVCCVIGSLGAGYVLLRKVWWGLCFILKYSPHP